MRQKTAYLVLGIFFTFFLTSCGSINVNRVSVDTEADFSGRWNDKDSQLVSQAMIDDLLNAGWLRQYITKQNRQPIAIVGTIINRSDEHINTQTFVKDLERALVNSGKVGFVASSSERTEIRDERAQQQDYASLETAKSHGEETGADFMLKGTINSITDRIEGKAVKYYQVNLELINIETNKKVWIGDKKIKKIVKRSSFTW